MDKIILSNMQFYGYHGLYPEENRLGQRFNVDLELYLSLREAGETDHMGDSVDYGKVFELVKQIVEGKPKNLIESVAETISKKLFESFPIIQACTIKVIKPDPPINGHYESVAVEIYREKNK